jgi:two-component system sensor histidine kinase/response regulator
VSGPVKKELLFADSVGDGAAAVNPMIAKQQPIRLLLVDHDSRELARLTSILDRAGGFETTWSHDRISALKEMGSFDFDAVLVSERVGATNGLELIREARHCGCTSPMILLTDGGEDLTSDAVGGPVDQLARDGLATDVLLRSIRHAVSHHATVTELERTRQELQHLRATSDEFLSSVSHDLRTPLSAIIGLAELLRDPEQTFDSTSRSEMIDTIVESGFEVGNLVEDLVTAARHEVGRLKVVAVPVSLAAQVNQTLETMALSVDVVIRSEAPRAQADPRQVRQILRNLLTNAAKHGGENVHVELAEHDGTALATVIDDGPGIPPDQEELIFGHPGTESESPHRLGIGLSVARELARHMGGDLTYVRSDDETRFELSLPIHPG